MAEWSIAAVLKTVEGHTSGGSNPSFSAEEQKNPDVNRRDFLFHSACRDIPSQLLIKYENDWLINIKT